MRLGLLLPRESPLAKFDEVPAELLEGAAVAMLGAAHGSAILAPVQRALGAVNARLTVPPEPHGMGVERYGRQFRMPAISLGWFGTGASVEAVGRMSARGRSRRNGLWPLRDKPPTSRRPRRGGTHSGEWFALSW